MVKLPNEKMKLTMRKRGGGAG